jgi:FkbM family methyltransferase
MPRLELLKRLLDVSGAPLTLADVGSMGGVEAEWAALNEAGLARVIGFEPDAREFKLLPRRDGVTYHNCALAARGGQAMTLHVAREPGKTSLYPPNMELLRRFPRPERWETVSKIEIAGERVRSLDEIVEGCDFIKLDTQGSELDILKGGEKVLAGVLGLKVEVEFLELYKGQPLFSDVDRFIREAGFELVDLRRVYWKRSELLDFHGRGQLAFGDALYVRSPESIKVSRAAAYAAICLVYGLRDRAAAVAPMLPGELAAGLRAADGGYGLRLPGRNRLLRWGRALARALSRSDQGFSDGDVGLGNG